MRNDLIKFLKSELIGPDEFTPLRQENGEEILEISPKERYTTGILFPQNITNNLDDFLYTDDDQQLDLFENPDTEMDIYSGNTENEEDTIIEEDITTLSNNYLPSAIGLSCFMNPPKKGLNVIVRCGQYEEVDVENRKKYYRIPKECIITITPNDFPSNSFEKKRIYLNHNYGLNLELYIYNRTPQKDFNKNKHFITFTLVNKCSINDKLKIADKYFYQIEFKVLSLGNEQSLFLPYPNQNQYLKNHDDDRSMQFLYRNTYAYAIGHGCAANWKEHESGKCNEIFTDLLPTYEIKPIIPNDLPNIELSMQQFANVVNKEKTIDQLSHLLNEYNHWIELQEQKLKSDVDKIWHSIANQHLNACRKCAQRISEGIEILNKNDEAFQAFTYMNEAMLLQQLHYNLDLKEWGIDEQNHLSVEKNKMPDINDISTWPNYDLSSNSCPFGKWRPFQIAFILMNIKSIIDPLSEDREIVDLIWFPTGGGKTEAYLGLTAFTIFNRKIKDFNDSGTTVLMRYTLRLLTAQQFQRASSLICACEYIRKRDEEDLGYSNISIGLWVGRAATPNDRSTAMKSLNALIDGKSKENPFVILKCPWCGTQFGVIDAKKRNQIKGYQVTNNPRTISFICENNDCFFAANDSKLPIYVIDEDIYEQKPTLLISTVDKFALLPWNINIKNLFGRTDEGTLNPPELIIQDELHLISGALGSVVGHFETIIHELCKQQIEEKSIGPKIIASTATISRAKEQIHSLYGSGKNKISIFPAQALESGETFFAKVDAVNSGRLYVGVHPTGLTSKITAQVRTVASLLQGVKYLSVENESKRDPYWTMVQYFNSLRDLGTAATLVQSYYSDHLKRLRIRLDLYKDDNKSKSRYISKVIELTSRVPGYNIPSSLQLLETNYDGTANKKPVDICLATNMLSVGVDIQRLGLMVVNGQPKTTSEYIQATSRVGRSKARPGLIITLYNPSRARDKSHFEQFIYYHSTIYSQVEPTSVTPFSSPVREKALHSLIITFIRYFGTEINSKHPRPYPDNELIEKLKNIIIERVKAIDPEELNDSLRKLEERLEEWEEQNPSEYGTFGKTENNSYLIFPAGTIKDDDMMDRAWPTLSSMRNVDRSCEATVISRYLS